MIEPVPLTTAQKTVVGLKKTTGKKKQNEIIKKTMAPFYGWVSTASRLDPL